MYNIPPLSFHCCYVIVVVLVANFRFTLRFQCQFHDSQLRLPTGLLDLYGHKTMPSSVALLIVAACQALDHMTRSKHEQVVSALQLWREIHGPLQDALGLPKEVRDKFPVIQCIDAANGRLAAVMEKQFIKLMKQCVEKFGASDIKGALDYLNSTFDLTKNTPIFMSRSTQGLRVASSCGGDVLDASKIPAEAGDLQTHLPTYVKISAADFTLFEELLPEKIKKLQGFQKLFKESLNEWLAKTQKILDVHNKMLNRYRPLIASKFHPFMPSCPTFLFCVHNLIISKISKSICKHKQI